MPNIRSYCSIQCSFVQRDYSEKLTAILAQNDIRSVTVVRMAVPCCGGIQRAAERAVSASGKPLSLHTVIVGTDGTLLRQA